MQSGGINRRPRHAHAPARSRRQLFRSAVKRVRAKDAPDLAGARFGDGLLPDVNFQLSCVSTLGLSEELSVHLDADEKSCGA
jgi:hypothetical protein